PDGLGFASAWNLLLHQSFVRSIPPQPPGPAAPAPGPAFFYGNRAAPLPVGGRRSREGRGGRMARDAGDGWRPWEAVPRIAAGAISVPVVVGFVALGAAVIVFRSLRDVARGAWARVPGWRGASRGEDRPGSRAACARAIVDVRPSVGRVRCGDGGGEVWTWWIGDRSVSRDTLSSPHRGRPASRDGCARSSRRPPGARKRSRGFATGRRSCP